MWLSFTNAAAASVPPRTERVAPTERTEHPAAPWRATRYALTGAEPGAAVVGAHTRETLACISPAKFLWQPQLLYVQLRTRGLTGHGAASPATEDMMLPVSKG